MQLYQRLKDSREDKDKTQSQIAEVLNMKQQQYARYEIGARELPLKHLATLCKYYNLSADYILGLTDERRALYDEKSENG